MASTHWLGKECAMKKKQAKKLKLNVETLRQLEEPKMREAVGGATIISCGTSCPEFETCPCPSYPC
jgi:natural product precursor